MKMLQVTSSLLVLLTGIVGAPRAQDDAKEDARTTKYAVVQTGDQLAVLDVSQLEEHKKKVAADFEAATKAWQDAKKAAQKSKTRFTEKKPAPIKVKVVANNLPSKEAADAALEKLLAKAMKGAEKPSRPKGGTDKKTERKKGKDGQR